MNHRQPTSTTRTGIAILLLSSIVASGTAGCSMPSKANPAANVSSHASNHLFTSGGVSNEGAGECLEPYVEDPATADAFHRLKQARATFSDSASSNRVAAQSGRMSQCQGDQVVEYPALDTIYGDGGWTPASFQFE